MTKIFTHIKSSWFCSISAQQFLRTLKVSVTTLNHKPLSLVSSDKTNCLRQFFVILVNKSMVSFDILDLQCNHIYYCWAYSCSILYYWNQNIQYLTYYVEIFNTAPQLTYHVNYSILWHSYHSLILHILLFI